MVQRIIWGNSDTRHDALVGDLYASFNDEALRVLSFHKLLYDIIHSQGRNRAVRTDQPGSYDTQTKHSPTLTL